MLLHKIRNPRHQMHEYSEEVLNLRTRLKGLLKAAESVLVQSGVTRQAKWPVFEPTERALAHLQKQVWRARKELGLK